MADRFPSSAQLLARQIGYQNRLFRRTAISAFFTLAFPLMFLLLFGAIFDDVDPAAGQVVAAAQFYAPALAVFTAVSATYTNIGIVTAIYRDEGVLMRIRSTPLPRWVYMGGVVGSGVLIALFGSCAIVALFLRRHLPLLLSHHRFALFLERRCPPLGQRLISALELPVESGDHSPELLAAATRRYFEHTIEAFGTDRCMFESNFPVDKVSCSYNVLWNAFKRLASNYTAGEKAQLFHDNAVRLYRIE